LVALSRLMPLVEAKAPMELMERVPALMTVDPE
jgi:hypothetical protein